MSHLKKEPKNCIIKKKVGERDMGHIPTATTAEAVVLTFEEAMRPSEVCGYDREKWIYAPDFYSEYRYILGTRGARPLIAIGINPSTAAPDDLDNTLKSVERIAHANGYDSFIMFNVYAQRATDPKHMEKTFNEELHRENMKAFEYVLSLSSAPDIWAAWGTIIETRQYLSGCVRDMIKIGEGYGARWFTCGDRSKKGGHPHHPLYLRRDARLEPFDVRDYITKLDL